MNVNRTYIIKIVTCIPLVFLYIFNIEPVIVALFLRRIAALRSMNRMFGAKLTTTIRTWMSSRLLAFVTDTGPMSG